MYVSLIFTTGVAFLLILSAVLKIMVLKESPKIAINLPFISEKSSNKLSYTYPFIELMIALTLLFHPGNLLVNTAAILMITLFVLKNFQAIQEQNQAECFCFGKLIKTKYGVGGLVQSLLLLVSLIPNLIFGQLNSSLFFIETDVILISTLIFVSIIWSITLLIIRSSIDQLQYSL